jgi:hypothetical protein
MVTEVLHAPRCCDEATAEMLGWYYTWDAILSDRERRLLANIAREVSHDINIVTTTFLLAVTLRHLLHKMALHRGPSRQTAPLNSCSVLECKCMKVCVLDNLPFWQYYSASCLGLRPICDTPVPGDSTDRSFGSMSLLGESYLSGEQNILLV